MGHVIIPESLYICGQDVTVKLAEPGDWEENGQGSTNAVFGRIQIRPGMPKSVTESVLFHEVIHFIADTNGLSVGGGNGKDEMTINVLANGLLAFLRDNREFTLELLREDGQVCLFINGGEDQ